MSPLINGFRPDNTYGHMELGAIVFTDNKKKKRKKMHCFACDKLLDAPALDVKTGRYYCNQCKGEYTELLKNFDPRDDEEDIIPDDEYVPEEIEILDEDDDFDLDEFSFDQDDED